MSANLPHDRVRELMIELGAAIERREQARADMERLIREFKQLSDAGKLFPKEGSNERSTKTSE